MREIIFSRKWGDFGMANYKVVIESEPTFQIGNGETKKVQLNNIPVKVYAKQGWVRSRAITIDNSTTEITLKNEKIKNRIAPGIGGLLLLFYLPIRIWDNSLTANTVSIFGISIIAAWTIYAFVIKRNEWILIEKK
ncbi:MAG: hypothetical protein RIA69_01775 [Cyclobacteriaceae bacterium]